MSDHKSKASEWQATSASNSIRLLGWSAAWVLTTALAGFGPKLFWDYQTGLTVLGVLINLAVGYGMIAATKRHIQGQDEMQQKIFRDAAVLSLGVGLICATSYELLEDIRLIAFEPEISHIVILMSLTFLAGMVAGHRKYR